jgi:hypothetical protein
MQFTVSGGLRSRCDFGLRAVSQTTGAAASRTTGNGEHNVAGTSDHCRAARVPSSINTKATSSLGDNWAPPNSKSCKTKMSHGFPIPDPTCTPGAFNPSLTLAVFQQPGFTTNCVRDDLTPASQKQKTYGWYGMKKPDNNSGPTETCELDHLVPLVMGGADSLDNIWPQCGPSGVVRKERYFPQKDCVEVNLGDQVRAGRNIPRDSAQVLGTS